MAGYFTTEAQEDIEDFMYTDAIGGEFKNKNMAEVLAILKKIFPETQKKKETAIKEAEFELTDFIVGKMKTDEAWFRHQVYSENAEMEQKIILRKKAREVFKKVGIPKEDLNTMFEGAFGTEIATKFLNKLHQSTDSWDADLGKNIKQNILDSQTVGAQKNPMIQTQKSL